MYLKAKPTGEAKDFIDWILSSEGQALIAQAGYYPIK
jgi:phosphate transport system substrate-binding protein